MLRVAAELELAGILTAAEAAQRLTELSLRFGENAAAALLKMSGPRQAIDRKPSTTEMMLIYGDYLRELAAASSLASMSFLSRLEALRAQRNPPRAGKNHG